MITSDTQKKTNQGRCLEESEGPRNGQQTREKGDQPHGDRRDGITGECPAQDRPKFKAGSIAFRLGSRFADADGPRL